MQSILDRPFKQIDIYPVFFARSTVIWELQMHNIINDVYNSKEIRHSMGKLKQSYAKIQLNLPIVILYPNLNTVKYTWNFHKSYQMY